MSPKKSDNEDAQMWFNCVEELVFTDEDFNSDLACLVSNGLLHRNVVQALQAAFMVCLYQNWEGSDASKRRIRRYRFATLVSVSPGIDMAEVLANMTDCSRHRLDHHQTRQVQRTCTVSI